MNTALKIQIQKKNQKGGANNHQQRDSTSETQNERFDLLSQFYNPSNAPQNNNQQYESMYDNVNLENVAGLLSGNNQSQN